MGEQIEGVEIELEGLKKQASKQKVFFTLGSRKGESSKYGSLQKSKVFGTNSYQSLSGSNRNGLQDLIKLKDSNGSQYSSLKKQDQDNFNDDQELNLTMEE